MTRSKLPPRTPRQDRPWRHHDARAHGRRRGGESQQPNGPRWVSRPPWGPHLWNQHVQLGQLMLVDVTLMWIFLVSWCRFFGSYILFVLHGMSVKIRKHLFKGRCEDPSPLPHGWDEHILLFGIKNLPMVHASYFLPVGNKLSCLTTPWHATELDFLKNH